MKLSVVVLSSADSDGLKRCVDGFASQAAAEAIAELLVVATRSDTALAPGGEHEERPPFPIIHVLPSEPSPFGPAAARNAAVARARGELVLFSSDRSLPAPGLVAGHMSAHVRSGGGHSVVGRRTLLASLPSTPLCRALEDSTDPLFFDRNPRAVEAGWSAFHTGNLSASRNLLKQNPFDERFESDRFTDLELGYRLARTGHRIEYREDLVSWHDRPTSLAEMRSHYRLYGSEVAAMHHLHSEERLAQTLGIADARAVERWLPETVAVAERSIASLESAIANFDLRSQRTRRCFGAHEAQRMLGECYATLAHYELFEGIREALGLPPLRTLSSPRPIDPDPTNN